MLDTSIQVKTDHFDGPLGLLLLLVEKEEMNIRELDLTNPQITYPLGTLPFFTYDRLVGSQQYTFDQNP